MLWLIVLLHSLNGLAGDYGERHGIVRKNAKRKTERLDLGTTALTKRVINARTVFAFRVEERSEELNRSL